MFYICSYNQVNIYKKNEIIFNCTEIIGIKNI